MGTIKRYWRKRDVSSLDGCAFEYRLFETFVGDEDEDYRSNIESSISVSQYKNGDLLFNDGGDRIVISVYHLRKLRDIVDEAIQYAESINSPSV